MNKKAPCYQVPQQLKHSHLKNWQLHTAVINIKLMPTEIRWVPNQKYLYIILQATLNLSYVGCVTALPKTMFVQPFSNFVQAVNECTFCKHKFLLPLKPLPVKFSFCATENEFSDTSEARRALVMTKCSNGT